MTESQWLSLALVCLLGAMSPGPSLAVVVRHSVTGGRGAGIVCAFSHAFGIFLWAAMMVGGLGVLLLSSPDIFFAVRLAGAAFLFYVGLQAIRARPADSALRTGTAALGAYAGSPAREGFIIALSNPKVAVFFAALFSQFISPTAPNAQQWIIAGTAATIDALWYAVVAVLLTRAAVLQWFQERIGLLNRFFGVILIALSLSIILTG